jgi:hypothetical protein
MGQHHARRMHACAWAPLQRVFVYTRVCSTPSCLHKQVQPVDKLLEATTKFVEELKTMPVAIHTSEANEQHYEVGGVFMGRCCLCWW